MKLLTANLAISLFVASLFCCSTLLREADAFAQQKAGPRCFAAASASRHRRGDSLRPPTAFRLKKTAYVPSLSQQEGDDDEQRDSDLSVNVKEYDVDAFTLTAIGFALIAFNFFVFANAGDGGLGGIVARIINISSQ